MSSEWLTEETAATEAERKLTAIKEFTSRPAATVDHAAVAEARESINTMARRLQAASFFASVGIVWQDDACDRETFYVSSALIGATFGDHRVVSWTHWIGRVATRLREAFEKGDYPLSSVYGPSGREAELSVGPYVAYEVKDGELRSLQFCDSSTDVSDLVDAEEMVDQASVDWATDQVTKGLTSITSTFDVDQDDVVRGPSNGAFLYYGGPGTGKTTLALHRIPYLIWSQVDEPEEDRPRKFSVDKTLVVVWKDHLVNYLRDCLNQLVDGTFPERNVRHIDNWVTELLRGYVSLGAKGWRLSDAPPPAVESVKNGLSEVELDEFLSGGTSVLEAARCRFAEELPQGFSSLLDERLYELRSLPRSPFSVPPLRHSVASFEQAAHQIRQKLPDTDAALFSEMQNKEISDLRKTVTDALNAGLSELNRHIDVLFEFYRSELVVGQLSDDEKAEFLAGVDTSQEQRLLSRADTYLLLWLIHLVTDDATTTKKGCRALPELTHIVVDEAQYYEPIVLRLLGSLVRLPDGVLTVVGDLEQRFAHDGGLASWDVAGLHFSEERKVHLRVNYRWSKEVFDFMSVFHRLADIDEQLARPHVFRVDGGLPPELTMHRERVDEFESIAARISELHDFELSRSWTIAVVVPESLVESAQVDLVAKLEEQFISSEWPNSRQVKPTNDHVTLTNYHSVVGLEFDAVFLPAADSALPTLNSEERQAFWVALTRARKFVYVTTGETHALFGAPELRRFRRNVSECSEVADGSAMEELTAEDWFRMASWARRNDKLNGWERKFSYNYGKRVSRGAVHSEKQIAKAEEIYRNARQQGFLVNDKEPHRSDK